MVARVRCQIWFTALASSGSRSMTDFARWMTVLSFLQGLIAAFGYALLMAAIFGWRKAEEPRLPEQSPFSSFR